MREHIHNQTNRISRLELQMSLLIKTKSNPEYIRMRRMQLDQIHKELELDGTYPIPESIHDLPFQESFLDPERFIEP